MVNTRIITQEIEYFEPGNIQEALELLDRYGPDAKIIAGGTDLLVQLKLKTVSPRFLISVRKIPELNIIENGTSLRIGAAVLLCDVLNACTEDGKYSALHEAVQSMATVHIRNMGTIGGNLCNASPAADSAPPLLALDAQVRICGLKSERILALSEFFKDVNCIAMDYNEILKEIEIPPLPEATGSAFLNNSKLGSDISKVSASAFIKREGDDCTVCRIALGSVAPTPIRSIRTEEFLIGKQLDDQVLEEAGKKVAEEIKPITDIRSTARYRKRVVAVLVNDVLKKAWQRSGAYKP